MLGSGWKPGITGLDTVVGDGCVSDTRSIPFWIGEAIVEALHLPANGNDMFLTKQEAWSRETFSLTAHCQPRSADGTVEALQHIERTTPSRDMNAPVAGHEKDRRSIEDRRSFRAECQALGSNGMPDGMEWASAYWKSPSLILMVAAPKSALSNLSR